MYKCEIIADSLSPQGNRLTTFKLTYPRIIHSELMTHRVFSRNSASSRAIPFEKMVKMVEEDPFIPIAWQKHHSGMQGSEYAQYPDTEDFKVIWLEARDNAIKSAKLAQIGKVKLTKQICNRLLEPFMWHTVLCTFTEYDGFFELRCPKYIFGKATNKPKIWKSKKDAIKDFPDWETHNDLFWRTMNESQAEIHIQALAEAMWDTYNESKPKELKAGEWHIPFGDKIEMSILDQQDLSLKFPSLNSLNELKIRIATARCARLSYMTFDGEIDYEKDLKLHDTLLESHHASPFEHCCRVLTEEEYNILGKMILHPKNGYVFENGWVDNFRGFISYRRILNI